MASDGETTCANDSNFAVIYSFIKVFGKEYGLETTSLIKLQKDIENTLEVSESLKDLHLRLLRRAFKSVQSNRWEKYLIKFCHQQSCHQEAWEIERFSYKKASTQVKLKVLKILLEYQFTCYSKFKNAVNAIPCNDLRLDPVGKDKNGCVYWLQIDEEANLCLYKEDPDEETWQLVASDKEGLVKVIEQLKKGEDIGESLAATINEDSNSFESPIKSNVCDKKTNSATNTDDESNDDKNTNENSEDPEISKQNKDEELSNEETTNGASSNEKHDKKEITVGETCLENQNSEKEHIKEETCNEDSENENTLKEVYQQKKDLSDHEEELNDKPISSEGKEIMLNSKTQGLQSKSAPSNVENALETTENENLKEDKIDEKEMKAKLDEKVVKKEFDVSEAIEEPVMYVSGDGNGEDCESFFIGEEIVEDVMYFWGEGSGFENDMGNPVKEMNDVDRESRNGECASDLNSPSSKTTKMATTIKLRSSKVSVVKRSLKKQSNDNLESSKLDPKKHCIRNIEKSDSCSTVNNSKKVIESNSEDTSSNNKLSLAKSKNKSTKKIKRTSKKVKLKIDNEINNTVSGNENDIEDAVNIIEKRKSSVSSEEQNDDLDNGGNEKDSNGNKSDNKNDEILPLKKLKLENDDEQNGNQTHDDTEREANDLQDSCNSNAITPRKSIKASRGKFRRVKKIKISTKIVNEDTEKSPSKKESKSLKRSLLDTTITDKKKSESPSESEAEEPITSGKRLKIRPKKVSLSSRKKVEQKMMANDSTDESEEETLCNLANKKNSNKLLKKKTKVRKLSPEQNKLSIKREPSDSELTPVRQSRRIAQLKIKEEADRRHMEEVALRKLKMIHKKGSVEPEPVEDEEEEWQASDNEKPRRRRRRGDWLPGSDTTPPRSDSDDGRSLFDMDREEEPDLEFTKSDHEFSPESDLENDEPAEPMKRARTLQQEADDGFCKHCKSGEQPEWILLCDRCDDGYHASCLKPVLFLVPEGDWFCPPCQHVRLIESLEKELENYEKLLIEVEKARQQKKLEEPAKSDENNEETTGAEEKTKEDKSDSSESSDSGSWMSSEEDVVYRLRERKQLPVSYHAREYDRLISSAIKEEYVEPTSSAGNQGRGKDISTIIEAAEEEKQKAEREANEQGMPLKKKRKERRKPRKLNSLDVPSEDDDETDEDFRDVGLETSSEDISSEAEKDSSNDSRSSDSLPIRRACRNEKKERIKMTESSPEIKKKKKGVFDETSSESSGAKDWNKKVKRSKSKKRRDKSTKSKSHRKRRGLTQYDAEGNVIRARVTYGGLSGEDMNDWSPKHRTRQKKINYTETPNTESEDEMHKSSGKHMPDSSDEFKISDSDATSDSDSGKKKKLAEESIEEKKKAMDGLITKTVVVPLEKLPEDVTKAKTEELQAHLEAQASAADSKSPRGRGGRASRGSRGPRGRRGGGRSSMAPAEDDEFSKLVGLKIKDLGANPEAMQTPGQVLREQKRQEREAKLAEKEARKQERLQKKEEKEKQKELKAKEREEKRNAKLAMQETKRMKKEKVENYQVPVPIAGFVQRPMVQEIQRMPNMYPQNIPVRNATEPRPPDQRFPGVSRLQVRPELRAMQPNLANVRAPPLHGDRQHSLQTMRDGTLSVAGSPQPYKPVSEEPSVITRMPHMMNQQYRGPMMYQPGNPPYGYGRGPPPNMMYQMHPHSLQHVSRQPYPPQSYYPPYPGQQTPPRSHNMSPNSSPRLQGPPGPNMEHRSPHPRFPQGHNPERPPHPGQMQPHNPDIRPPHRGMPGHGPDIRSLHPGMMPGHHPDARPPQPGMPHGQEVRPHPGLPPDYPDVRAHFGYPPHRSQERPPHAALAQELRHGSPGHPRLPHGGGHEMRPLGMPPGSVPPRGSPLHTSGTPPSPAAAMHGQVPPPSMMTPNQGSGMAPTNIIRVGNPASIPPHPGLPFAKGPPLSDVRPSYPPLGLVRSSTSPNHGLPNPKSSGSSSTTENTPATSSIDPSIKIKTEVKTEPEFSRDSNSPKSDYQPDSPVKDDVRPIHPKIKHTEKKDRRPRYPLGPYAPQYGPYGPYAPPVSTQSQEHHPDLINLQTRGPLVDHPPPMSHRMPSSLHQFHTTVPHDLGSKLRHTEPTRSPGASSPHDRLPNPQLGPPHHAYPPGYPPHPSSMPHHFMHPPHPGNPSHLQPPPRPQFPIPIPQYNPPERASPQDNSRIIPTHPHTPQPNSDKPDDKSNILKELPTATIHAAPTPTVIATEPLSQIPETESKTEASTDTNAESDANKSSSDFVPKADEKLESEEKNIPVNVPEEKELIVAPEIKSVDTDVQDDEAANASQETEEDKTNDSKNEDTPKEEGSVFGGLVSYFSSQREDDIDS